MCAVCMRNYDRLVLPQFEFCQDSIGDSLHRGAVNRIARIEAQCKMVNWLRHSHILRGSCAHDLRPEHWVIRREIAPAAPCDTPFGVTVSAGDEVSTKCREAPTAARYTDH